MPFSTQQSNLTKMLGFLSRVPAQDMLRAVWEFSDFQLFCVVREDERPSKYSLYLDEFRKTGRRCDIIPSIELRKTERMEEAFVHELLHLELRRRGYMSFLPHPPTDPKRLPLASGIQNIADHVIMLPIFLEFGYSADRFLGPGSPLTKEEKDVVQDIGQMSAKSTPNEFAHFVSEYLSHHGIHFESFVWPPAPTAVTPRAK